MANEKRVANETRRRETVAETRVRIRAKTPPPRASLPRDVVASLRVPVLLFLPFVLLFLLFLPFLLFLLFLLFLDSSHRFQASRGGVLLSVPSVLLLIVEREYLRRSAGVRG